MGRLIAWISHKGGTGRTVALANTAFHLARPSAQRPFGSSVVCVDIDLASPTMGAVFGLPGAELGAERGVHDLISVGIDASWRVSGDQVSTLLLDLWAAPGLSPFMPGADTQLRLLPGRMGGTDITITNDDQLQHLGRALEVLKQTFDFVFVDVRSGLSEIGARFAFGGLRPLVDQWVVLHRWTRQHLHGAKDLVEKIGQKWEPDSIWRVITAKTEPTAIAPEYRDWVTLRDTELHRLQTDLLRAYGREAVAVIPDELILRWQECVITPDLVRAGMASPRTLDSFLALAERIAAV